MAAGDLHTATCTRRISGQTFHSALLGVWNLAAGWVGRRPPRTVSHSEMRALQWLAVAVVFARASTWSPRRHFATARSHLWPARNYATAPAHRKVPIRKWRRSSLWAGRWQREGHHPQPIAGQYGGGQSAEERPTRSRQRSSTAHHPAANAQHWFDKRQPNPKPQPSTTTQRHPTPSGQIPPIRAGQHPDAEPKTRPTFVSTAKSHSTAKAKPKPRNPQKPQLSVRKPAVADLKSLTAGRKSLSLRIRRVEPDVPPEIKRHLLAKMAQKGNNSDHHLPAGFHSEVLSHQITLPQHIRSRGISFIDIALGTPPQPMRVVLDTGSDELWVARAKGCQDEGTTKAICSCQTFHEPSSSTQILTDKLDIQYGSGFVKGVYADDSNFILGDPKCKTKMQVEGKFKFGLGMQHEGMSEMSGILGMCFPLPPKKFMNPGEAKGDSLMEQLIANGMDAKFSTYVKRCNPPAQGNRCKDGGILTLGKHDTQHCGKEITTVSIKNFRNPGDDRELPFASHWSFDADGIWMETPDGRAETSMKDKKFTTITDSGTSGMLVPGDLYDRFRALLPDSCEDQGQFKFCPCDIQFSVMVKINGVTIPIHARDMMLTASSDGKACQILFMRSDDEFIFGDPFVRTVCHHHFWTEKKITFAQLK